MYLIANLAIGGSWGGQPDINTIFPGRYEIRRIAAWPLGKQPVDLKNWGAGKRSLQPAPQSAAL